MDKNRIRGAVAQGEWARYHEALVIKAEQRKFGGCTMKECVLTRGDLAESLKEQRHKTGAVQAEAIVAGQTQISMAKG